MECKLVGGSVRVPLGELVETGLSTPAVTDTSHHGLAETFGRKVTDLVGALNEEGHAGSVSRPVAGPDREDDSAVGRESFQSGLTAIGSSATAMARSAARHTRWRSFNCPGRSAAGNSMGDLQA